MEMGTLKIVNEKDHDNEQVFSQLLEFGKTFKQAMKEFVSMAYEVTGYEKE